MGLIAIVTFVLPPTFVPKGISIGFVPFDGHLYKSMGDPIMAWAMKKQEDSSTPKHRSGSFISCYDCLEKGPLVYCFIVSLIFCCFDVDNTRTHNTQHTLCSRYVCSMDGIDRRTCANVVF